MNTKYLTKIVAASMLGDGHIRIPNDGSINAQYMTSKTEPHLDYLEWLDDRLSTLTKTSRYRFQPKMLNALPCIVLKTGCLPFYTKFRERMYGTGQKCVDPHYLTLLDWEFMAVWFQEDGTLNTRYRKNCYEMQASIATNCFSYGDHVLLTRAIEERLGFPAHIRKYTGKSGNRQYNIVFRTKFIPKLLDGMAPFIQPSFAYKCSYDKLLVKYKDDDIVHSSQECEVSAEMTEQSNKKGD
jgi:hypothetical protein